MEKSIIEQYLESTVMDLVKDVRDRIIKLHTEYKESKFGLYFFYDICFQQNCKADLIWYRDVMLKAHLDLCKANKLDAISKTETRINGDVKYEHFCYDYVKNWYDKLSDVENMSFINIMRLDDPRFGYSKAAMKKQDEEIKRFIDEMIENGEL